MSATAKLPYLIVLVGLTACGGAQRSWMPFTAADAGFSVFLPGKPKAEREGAEKNGMATRTYSTGSSGLGGEYGVIVWDSPESVDLASMSEGQIIKLLKEGFLEELEGQEIANDYRLLGGRRAREIQIETAKHVRIHARVLVMGQRIYVAMTGNSRPDAHTEERERFFASFALTESPVAPARPPEGSTPTADILPAATPAAAPAPASEDGSLTAPDPSKFDSYAIRTRDGREFAVDWFEIAQGKVFISMGGGEIGILQKDVDRIEGLGRDSRLASGSRFSASTSSVRSSSGGSRSSSRCSR